MPNYLSAVQVSAVRLGAARAWRHARALTFARERIFKKDIAG